MKALTEDVLRRLPLPDPDEGDKRARGTILVIGGSVEIPGAALLSGVAALRAGAGRLRIATCKRHASSMAIAVPEARVVGLDETTGGGIAPAEVDKILPLVEDADALLVGPGLDDQAAIDRLVTTVLENMRAGPPVVFDARSIKGMRAARGSLERHAGRLVMTPHGGEIAGLLGHERQEMERDPGKWATEASNSFDAVVVLKGARTVIACPREESYSCESHIGLATSGSGDVLAGIIAGLLARGANPFAAACWGVHVHTAAGLRLTQSVGKIGFLARDLLPEIPPLLHRVS